jgi:hypothetical protein
MLYRYLSDGPAPDALVNYSDRNMISTWTDARAGVNWAVYNEIMGQNTGNMLNPGSNATRAEAITMLHRVVAKFNIPAP